MHKYEQWAFDQREDLYHYQEPPWFGTVLQNPIAIWLWSAKTEKHKEISTGKQTEKQKQKSKNRKAKAESKNSTVSQKLHGQ